MSTTPIHDRIDPKLRKALQAAETKVEAARAHTAELEARMLQPPPERAELEAAEVQQQEAERARGAAQQAVEAAYAERWQAGYDAAMEQLRTVVADVDQQIAAWQQDSAQRRRAWGDAIETAINQRAELVDARPSSLAGAALDRDHNEAQDAMRRVMAARTSAERRERALDGGTLWQ